MSEEYLLKTQQSIVFKEFDYKFYKNNLKELDKHIFDAAYNTWSFKRRLITAVVALNKNMPVGFYILKNKIDSQKICSIHLLAVFHKYRKQGIGQQLISHIIENVRKLKFRYIDLEAHKDNKVAIYLYIKNGFTIHSEIKDRYIMRKKIQY